MNKNKRESFIVPNEFMVPVGAQHTQDTGKCADSWTDSELQLLRSKLPPQYHAVPTDALGARWRNIRKRGTPGYHTKGHGPGKSPTLSPKYQEALKRPGFREYFDSLCVMFSYRCAICNSVGKLAPHHRTYDHLGSETNFDCIPVCRKCHKTCDKRRRSTAANKKNGTLAPGFFDEILQTNEVPT